MRNDFKKTGLRQEVEQFTNDSHKLGLDIWTSFIKYWSLRKVYPLIPSLWFDLIESDYEFRQVFSDEVAEELIILIDKGRLTKEVVNLMRD